MSGAARAAAEGLETPTGRGAVHHAGTRVRGLVAASPSTQVWSAFTVSLALALVVAFSSGVHSFSYGDSASYWALGLTFIKHGSFSFTSFKSPTWGYVFPLYDLVLHEVAQTLGLSALAIIRISNCLIVAALATSVVPRMAHTIWPDLSFNFVRRVVVTALFLVFWRGWLDFSLTDFLGLLLLIMALSFLATSRSILRYLLAGVFTALACNIRPSYLPVLIVMALLVVRNFSSVGTSTEGARTTRRIVVSGGRRAALCVGAFILGLILVSFPQAWLNHTHYETWSPVAGAPGKVDLVELDDGMLYQRFESVVIAHAAAAIVYPDPSTSKLLHTLPGREITGYGEYLRVVVRHPLVMVGAFGRRLINGFDVHYSTPYTPHIIAPPDWLDLASCTVCFLALLRLLHKRSRRLLGRMDGIYLASLVLLCVTSLPTLIEPRFMLTGDVIAYALCVAPGWRTNVLDTGSSELLRLRWRTIVIVTGAYVLWLAVWFSVIGTALGSYRIP